MKDSDFDKYVLVDRSLAQKYNIEDLPLYIAREEIYDFPVHKTVPHWNDGLETIYVRKGEIYISDNGKKLLLKEGDIAIVEPGCVHFLESKNNENCIYYCGVASEEIFSNTAGIFDRYVGPLFHSMNPHILIIANDSDKSSEIQSLFLKINFVLLDKPPAYELRIVAAFHKYIALVFEAFNPDGAVPHSNISKAEVAIRNMLSYIHKHYSESISIEVLCKEGLVSRNNCFAIFEKYTGDTPANYILKYRLITSRRMLKNTDMSLSEIASACGFTHQSHFTNHFTKHHGITPLQYRKKSRM